MKRFFSSSFFALLSLFVAAPFAFASQTATLLPISNGNYVQWTPKSGSNHAAMVDETTCNGITDYNEEATLTQRDSYNISLTSVPDGATITQIDITPCASRRSTGTGSTTLDVFYRLNSVNSVDAGAYALPTGTTPSVLSTTSFTGLSTVKSSSTAFEIGGVYSAGNRGVRLSQITTQITYTPLATPSGLSSSATGSSVTLNWSDNSSNEDGFEIERSDNGGTFNQIASVSANTNSYPDSNLSAGTYTYRVRAYNSGGETGYTATTTAYVLNAPSGLTAIATGSSVAINWTDNSSNEDGFKIEIATGAGSFVPFKTVAANVSSSSATSLVQNTYSFRVRAYKSTNSNSDYSNTAVTTVLSAPSSLVAAVSGININLTWNDNSSAEDGFKIERSYNGGAYSQIDTVSADITSYSDNGLAGGAYSYKVRAYTMAGDHSNYATSSTVNVIIAPTGLTAVSLGTTATGSAVTLNWTDNSTNEDGFKIEIASGGGSFVMYKTLSANTISYTTLVLLPNDYSFRVRAYKSANNSDYSNTATTTVFAAPTGLGASVVGSDVTLNWTDNATGEDGFRVERSDNGGAYVEIGTVGTDVTTYFDPGLTSGNYNYRIRTYKGADTSFYSSSANALIP